MAIIGHAARAVRARLDHRRVRLLDQPDHGARPGVGDRLLAVHRVPVPGGAAPRPHRARRRRALRGDRRPDRRDQRAHRRRVVVGAADLPPLLPAVVRLRRHRRRPPGDGRRDRHPARAARHHRPPRRLPPGPSVARTRRCRGDARVLAPGRHDRHAPTAADRPGGDPAAAPARRPVPAPVGRPARRAGAARVLRGPAGVRAHPGRVRGRQRRVVPDRGRRGRRSARSLRTRPTCR